MSQSLLKLMSIELVMPSNHLILYHPLLLRLSIFPGIRGFHGGSGSKESTCNVGDLGLIPALGKSPGGEHGNPFEYSCLENPHGQRSLAGYSPWGCKELDMTE